jgi:hypothetical protein
MTLYWTEDPGQHGTQHLRVSFAFAWTPEKGFYRASMTTAPTRRDKKGTRVTSIRLHGGWVAALAESLVGHVHSSEAR